jgi:surface carbohydrate biosynthesis protein
MANLKNTGFLYLPMEIAVRELDSRLLIALMAVERGMEVVLGQKWLMEANIAAMPRGMWIFKTLTRRDGMQMKKAKAAGHLVASLDEEVAAFGEGSGGLQGVSEEAAVACDQIYCLGAAYRDSVVKKWPALRDKLELTGNPRWDFLRPELRSLYIAQARDYNARFGRIILINTNAGNANPIRKKPEEVLSRYVKSGDLDPDDPEAMSYWDDLWTFENANLRQVPLLARKLSQLFPEHTVILRPHPSERLETYADQLKDCPKIKVLFEGSAAPWIAAADLLIHTDCTTGIEAFALGKPSICYETVPSRFHEILLSGKLSFTVQTEDAALAEASRLLSLPPGSQIYPQSMTDVFQRFFTAQSGQLAAERLAESVCAKLGIASSSDAGDDFAEWSPAWHFRPRWYIKPKHRLKFPPISETVLQERFRQLVQALGKGQVPQVVSCGDSLFHVFRQGLGKTAARRGLAGMASRALTRLGKTA